MFDVCWSTPLARFTLREAGFFVPLLCYTCATPQALRKTSNRGRFRFHNGGVCGRPRARLSPRALPNAAVLYRIRASPTLGAIYGGESIQNRGVLMGVGLGSGLTGRGPDPNSCVTSRHLRRS